MNIQFQNISPIEWYQRHPNYNVFLYSLRSKQLLVELSLGKSNVELLLILRVLQIEEDVIRNDIFQSEDLPIGNLNCEGGYSRNSFTWNYSEYALLHLWANFD